MSNYPKSTAGGSGQGGWGEGGRWFGGVRLGGQGGDENSKKKLGGGGRVRVDVNRELKFFVKIQKKNSWGGGGGVR